MSAPVIEFLPTLAARLAAQCRNLTGHELRPETQQRLVDAVVDPREESWLAARPVMVLPGVPVAEAVRAYLGGDPGGAPSPEALCFALGQALAGVPSGAAAAPPTA